MGPEQAQATNIMETMAKHTWVDTEGSGYKAALDILNWRTWAEDASGSDIKSYLKFLQKDSNAAGFDLSSLGINNLSNDSDVNSLNQKQLEHIMVQLESIYKTQKGLLGEETGKISDIKGYKSKATFEEEKTVKSHKETGKQIYNSISGKTSGQRKTKLDTAYNSLKAATTSAESSKHLNTIKDIENQIKKEEEAKKKPPVTTSSTGTLTVESPIKIANNAKWNYVGTPVNQWNEDDLKNNSAEEAGYVKVGNEHYYVKTAPNGNNASIANMAAQLGAQKGDILSYNGVPYLYFNKDIARRLIQSDDWLHGNSLEWGFNKLKESLTFKSTPMTIGQRGYMMGGSTAFKTGGLADFTGPAWLDGTKSHPELVLNAQDTQNFIQLKDILSEILTGTNTINKNESNQASQANTFDIDINVEKIGDDYDVEELADKIRSMLYTDASYRNVNNISRMR